MVDQKHDEATLSLTLPIDLTALRALVHLRKLTIDGGSGWIDLSPLNTLPLEELTCSPDFIVCNRSVLKGMPTLKTINGESTAEYLRDIRPAEVAPEGGEPAQGGAGAAETGQEP